MIYMGLFKMEVYTVSLTGDTIYSTNRLFLKIKENLWNKLLNQNSSSFEFEGIQNATRVKKKSCHSKHPNSRILISIFYLLANNTIVLPCTSCQAFYSNVQKCIHIHRNMKKASGNMQIPMKNESSHLPLEWSQTHNLKWILSGVITTISHNFQVGI